MLLSLWQPTEPFAPAGICLSLLLVFRRRHGCAVRLMWGVGASRTISSLCSPAASLRRIPVADKCQQPAHLIISCLTGLLHGLSICLWEQVACLGCIAFRHVGLGKGIAAFNAMLPHHKIDDGPHRPEDALDCAKRHAFARTESRKAAASDDEYEVMGLLPNASDTYLPLRWQHG